MQVFLKATYNTQALHNESQIVQFSHFCLSETGTRHKRKVVANLFSSGLVGQKRLPALKLCPLYDFTDKSSVCNMCGAKIKMSVKLCGKLANSIISMGKVKKVIVSNSLNYNDGDGPFDDTNLQIS